MSTYILLRDNKESTPLGLGELKKLGLKPTDLIWVEGQSVCWLHPGQIKELKDIGMPEEVKAETRLETPEIITAPEITTEEPVKKEVNHTEEKVSISIPAVEPPGPVEKSSIEKKKVFVALPKQTLKPTQPKQVFPEKKIPVPVTVDQDLPVETKYSKPLDEIKEIYLENLERRKHSQFHIPPHVKRAAFYVILFIGGITAGILLNKSFSKKDAMAQTNTRTASEIRTGQDNEVLTELPNSEVINSAMTEDPAAVPAYNSQVKTFPRQTFSNNPAMAESLSQNTTILPVPAPDMQQEEEKNKSVEEEKPVRKPSIKEIYSQVSVRNNDYTVGSFGGIKNLELTVNNSSRYALDEVEVLVQYLKPGDELIKTETISVKGIGPGASKTIPVKKTNRGVKVSVKVSNIESKDFQTSTAQL